MTSTIFDQITTNDQNKSKNKQITISLNPILLEVIDKIAFIYDKTIEEYVKEAVEMSIESDISNKEDEVGKKTCEKLRRILM